MSLRNIKNNSDPRTDTFGTPDVTVAEAVLFLIYDCWLYPVGKVVC